MAEEVGFEPTDGREPPLAFKANALDQAMRFLHMAESPGLEPGHRKLNYSGLSRALPYR